MPAADLHPPRAIEALLRRLLAPAAFETIAGDLEETYRARVAAGEPVARARLRYAVLALRSARDYRAGNRRPRTSPRIMIPRTTLMGTLPNDLRFTLRSLRRSPGLLAAVTLTLGLGVGANAAIFAIVYGSVLRPLPYPEPDRLVAIHEVSETRGWSAANASPANFLDWRERSEQLDDITAHSSVYGAALTGGERPQWIQVINVYHNFFDVLGVRPMLGQPFGDAATWGAEDPPVLISRSLWMSHFGGDPDVIGERLLLNGRPRTIGGVMPSGIAYPAPGVDVWDSFGWSPEFRSEEWFRRAHFVETFGRTGPGATVTAAGDELESIAVALEQEYPATNTGMRTLVRPLQRTLVGEARTPLLVLLGAVGLVMLVACANIANLLIARAADRAREVGIRVALGASRARIARQLLTESLVLAGLGGVLGGGLAWIVTRALLATGAGSLPRIEAIRFDGPVLAFLVGTVIAAGLAFGIGPAWQLARVTRGGGLDPDRRTASVDRRARRSRAALVLAEIALAVVLVTGAALMSRTLVRLTSIDPGFDPERRLVVQLQLPTADYPDRAAVEAFHEQLRQRLESSPGIVSIGRADGLPLEGSGWTSDAHFEGHDFEIVEFNRRIVDRGYQSTMGVPLVAGRWFDATDTEGSTPVAVVNETLAEQYFPGSSPVGLRVALVDDASENDWLTVVGVVGSERLEGLDSRPWPEVFLPSTQITARRVSVVVRWDRDAERPDALVRTAVAELDPNLPLITMRTMSDIARGTVGTERLLTTLLAGFGVLALSLAGVGVGALVARSVMQRRREIGVRLALGAGPGSVVRMLVRDGLVPVGGGLVIGIAIAVAAAAALRTLLYEVSPFDPVTLAAVSLVLVGVALVATWIPARRAARIDPVNSLRAD